VPLYLANLLDVMGDTFEDPLASMDRMFTQHFGADGPTLDDEGLLRMDDRELTDAVQGEMERRFEAAQPGDAFDEAAFDRFMRAYERTRGFSVDGVDYDAELETDEL
jgi:enoyl-[acyl-carrier protein] reductase/trans-2-enoyl-CoA reductase (NAD+)